MKPLVKGTFGCALAMQDVGAMGGLYVRKDTAGLPTAWRLLPMGKFTLTRDGQELEGELDPEIAGVMMASAAAKGTPLPLDLHHNLKLLADALGMDEPELAKVLPQGVLTIGFAKLAQEPDGLWVDAVEWTDVGRKLIGAGLFRYFSPVIRGLSDGRYRITSVTLTNHPALQRLDAIAASDDGPDGAGRAPCMADLQRRAAEPSNQETNVDPQYPKLLGTVLEMDSITLAADGAVSAEVKTKLAALAAELPKLRLLAGTAGKVRDALALSADAGEPQVLAALQGLQAKGQAHDSLKAQVDALALEAETNKRAKVIERGLAEGKLTKALVDGWAKGQDAAALEAYLQHAPVVVTPGKLVDTGRLPADGDSLALTDADRKVAAVCGLKPEDVESAMKARRN